MSIDSITLERDKIKEFMIPVPVAEAPSLEKDKKG